MDIEELEGKKVADLKDLASTIGIVGFSTMRKPKLVDEIYKKLKVDSLPKLKPSLIGGTTYHPVLKTMTTITEAKTEMFRNLGMHELFENDSINSKRPGESRNTDIDRVGESGESD